jgi:hypothetical protein
MIVSPFAAALVALDLHELENDTAALVVCQLYRRIAPGERNAMLFEAVPVQTRSNQYAETAPQLRGSVAPSINPEG